MANGPLGSITKSASPPSDESLRERRWRLLSVVRVLLPKERVSDCNRKLVPKSRTVDIYRMNIGGKAHYKNLRQCGSVWTCPVCAAKISKRRGTELTEAIKRSKYTGFLVTFTLQHNKGSDIETLINDLVNGVRFNLSGAPAQRFYDRFQIVGSISDLEYTCSLKNGHHPHKHIVFLTKLSREEINRSEIREEIEAFFGRYGKHIERKGYLVNDHTVDLRTDHDGLETYLTKWGLSNEVSRGQDKEGRTDHFTPFQLLDRISQTEGNEQSQLKQMFCEYAHAFKGKRQLTYSKGLRSLLELNQEKSDTELVEETEEPSTLFARLTYLQWKKLLQRENLGTLGKVLDIASLGDMVSLWQYLESIGVNVTEFQWEKALAINGPNWETFVCDA